MTEPMDYLALLEHSYTQDTEFFYMIHSAGSQSDSRLEYLAKQVFGFTTYDGEMDKWLTTKAVEVCEAISAGKTFAYQNQSHEHYRWYITMVNMPFFEQRLNWGTSIRGAWWDVSCFEEGKLVKDKTVLRSCGLYLGEDHQVETQFTTEQWKQFIAAVVTFARVQMDAGKEESPLTP